MVTSGGPSCLIGSVEVQWTMGGRKGLPHRRHLCESAEGEKRGFVERNVCTVWIQDGLGEKEVKWML